MLQSLRQRLDQQRPAAAAPLGWRCFQLGLVFLASSALIAGLLLLLALILGTRGRVQAWWPDGRNRALALVAVLMLLGALQVSLPAFAVPGYVPALAWLGLFNWLPFFWAFWGFQPYLADAAARRRAALCLVAGTVPVLVTGLGQLCLGWSGPWQVPGAVVVWWLAPGGNPPGRLSGLFDYANITAAWLSLSWPLLLAALLEAWRRCWNGGRRWPVLVVLGLAVAQVAALYLTESRNAWGALLLALPIVLGPARWRWLLPLLGGAVLVIALASVHGVPSALQDPAQRLVPAAIWERLSDVQYGDQRPLATTRLAQWGTALQLVGQRPWLGWGAASFSTIYPRLTGQWHGHPHNLPVDLAVSHGLPVALLVVGFVVALLLQGVRLGMIRGPLSERAWWTSALVLLALHATDMPFYDSRLNLAGWILLAGVAMAGRPASHPDQIR